MVVVREAAPGVWYAAASGRPLTNDQGDVMSFPTADAAKAAADAWDAHANDEWQAADQTEYAEHCWDQEERRKAAINRQIDAMFNMQGE